MNQPFTTKARKRLLEFIKRAKQHSRDEAENIEPSPFPGTKLHQFSEGDLAYLDLYAGTLRFSGTEMVFHQFHPLWCMSYHGHVQRESIKKYFSNRKIEPFTDEIHQFLRRALQQPIKLEDFRGPSSYHEKDWEYECDQEDCIRYFSGEERIYHKYHRVYLCTFQGQMLF